MDDLQNEKQEELNQIQLQMKKSVDDVFDIYNTGIQDLKKVDEEACKEMDSAAQSQKVELEKVNQKA